MPITDIYSQLTRDEGIRLVVYTDTRGFSSIGIGHNLDANPLPNYDLSNFTMADAEAVLQDDVARITARLILDIPWLAGFKSTQPVRFGVYQNLAFNMGAGGVMEFHHALADAQAGNWVQCAADMRASLWYTQVGARAERLCTQMETGVWQ